MLSRLTGRTVLLLTVVLVVICAGAGFVLGILFYFPIRLFLCVSLKDSSCAQLVSQVGHV